MKIDQDIDDLVFRFQKILPVDIRQMAHALGIKVEKDPRPPVILGWGQSYISIRLFPHTTILYNDKLGFSPKTISFNIAVGLGYYIEYNDIMKDKIKKGSFYNQDETGTRFDFFRYFWSKDFAHIKQNKKALARATSLLVPHHTLKKMVKENIFRGDLTKMSEFFGVHPSLISISLGIPHEQ
jgi:hypothetical protein